MAFKAMIVLIGLLATPLAIITMKIDYMTRYNYNLKTGEIYEGDVLLGTFTPINDGGKRLRMLSLIINANKHCDDIKSGKIALAELASNFIKQATSLHSS